MAVAVVAVLGIGLVGVEPASAGTGEMELEFAAMLNEMRAAKGLAPLAIKGELFDLARSWSTRMAAAGGISHNGNLAAEGPSNWSRLGENVGVGSDVAGLHEAFVNSPLHYKNMVDPQFDSVGVGVVKGANDATFVTVNFMTTKAAPAKAKAKAVRCTKNRRGKVVCTRR